MAKHKLVATWVQGDTTGWSLSGQFAASCSITATNENEMMLTATMWANSVIGRRQNWRQREVRRRGVIYMHWEAG